MLYTNKGVIMNLNIRDRKLFWRFKNITKTEKKTESELLSEMVNLYEQSKKPRRQTTRTTKTE